MSVSLRSTGRPRTLSEARQQRIPTSSTRPVRTKRVNYLELNDGLDDSPEPVNPKKRRRYLHAPSRTGPSDSRLAAQELVSSPKKPSRKRQTQTTSESNLSTVNDVSRNLSTIRGIQKSATSHSLSESNPLDGVQTTLSGIQNTRGFTSSASNPVFGIQNTKSGGQTSSDSMPVGSSTPLDGVHDTLIGGQTRDEDTLPDLGISVDPTVDSILTPSDPLDDHLKEALSTEEELDAADALLSLQNLRTNQFEELEDDNAQLMPIGGGINIPEDVAPQPLLLDQVNVDNVIANIIATEQDTMDTGAPNNPGDDTNTLPGVQQPEKPDRSDVNSPENEPLVGVQNKDNSVNSKQTSRKTKQIEVKRRQVTVHLKHNCTD